MVTFDNKRTHKNKISKRNVEPVTFLKIVNHQLKTYGLIIALCLRTTYFKK